MGSVVIMTHKVYRMRKGGGKEKGGGKKEEGKGRREKGEFGITPVIQEKIAVGSPNMVQ
ncbi:MAG: hypothetical protein GX565_00390 [Lentisphaerae bacterium]|nr:hypothetical protein [Lentisphaerota bacterium]